MTIWTNPVRRVEGLWLEDFQTPAKDYLAARAGEAFVRNPLPSLIRMGEVEQASGRAQDVRTFDETGAPLPEEPFPQPRELSEVLSPEQATARAESVGLSFTKPTRAEVVDILVRRKKAEVARQTAVRRGSGGFGLEATALGLDLLVTAADPLNVASAFVPVVREARFAAWAARSSPAVARLGRGAIEGAAGAAIVEPLVLGAATQEQADYDMVDSLLNLAFGTALGGGLHAGAGAVADVAARRAGRPTLSERLQGAPHAVREAALRTAVAQAMEGRQVDVEPVLSGSRFLDETSLSTRAQRFEPEAAPEATVQQAASGGISGQEFQVQAEPESVTLLPLETRKGERRVYKTEEAARRAADKRGGSVLVQERPEGGFELLRGSEAEPLREPGGAVRSFPNERQARRFMERTMSPAEREGLEVVPFGPAGERRHAIVRGASERDLTAMRAAPERVRFPEVRRERLTRQEPTALLTRRSEPTLEERINAAVQRNRDPRQIALADFRAAERAEEIVKQIPVDETADTAQQFLDDASEAAQEVKLALGISDEEFDRVFSELTQAVDEAEALGRAARAAALCDLRA